MASRISCKTQGNFWCIIMSKKQPLMNHGKAEKKKPNKPKDVMRVTVEFYKPLKELVAYRNTLLGSLYVPKLPATIPEWLLLPPGLWLPLEKDQNRWFWREPCQVQHWSSRWLLVNLQLTIFFCNSATPLAKASQSRMCKRSQRELSMRPAACALRAIDTGKWITCVSCLCSL